MSCIVFLALIYFEELKSFLGYVCLIWELNVYPVRFYACFQDINHAAVLLCMSYLNDNKWHYWERTLSNVLFKVTRWISKLFSLYAAISRFSFVGNIHQSSFGSTWWISFLSSYRIIAVLNFAGLGMCFINIIYIPTVERWIDISIWGCVLVAQHY